MSGDYISKEEAIELLAECLYLRMERMDPCGRGTWRDLNDSEREFYRAGVREILLAKTLVNLAINDSRDFPTITK